MSDWEQMLFPTGGGGGGTVTSVSAGNGLDFTTITTSGSVILGTPSTITATSTNGVTTTSHTHALDESGISITASQVSDFDTEVSNNSDVSDNTDFRTTPSTVITAGTNIAWDGNTLNVSVPEIGDFADGGEAGGADRTLGNTDAFDLGFLTNGVDRLHIQNDGKIGIGTTTPSYKLEVDGDINISTGNAYKINGNNFIEENGTDGLSIGKTGGVSSSGELNILMGREVGNSSSTGDYNFILGAYSGRSLTSGAYNTSVGIFSYQELEYGNRNTAIGSRALRMITGSGNTGLGYSAGGFVGSGNDNVFIGHNAGNGVSESDVSDASYNVLIGSHTGTNLYTGANYNTLLGYWTANTLTTGSNNIIIGYDVDVLASDTDNFLNIGDTIYGDLSTGNVGIGKTAPTAYLHLKAGTASAGTAPIKLTAGTLNTTEESGTIEFDGSDFYITI